MMKVYRISKCIFIENLSGAGAAAYPGRWHNKGTHILYTAASASLALLESVVHLAGILIPDYCLLCLEVPDKSILDMDIKKLPANWKDNPSSDTLKLIGDAFINENKFLLLKIPSAIIPEECNYLINPAHKDFKGVKVVYTRVISIDRRLLS